jgi:hypothetical protein
LKDQYGACSHDNGSGALGVTAKYRLQFLGASTVHGAAVLVETNIVAGSVDAAIRHAAEAEWPPGVAALRLVDLDGREVYERTKVDRSCVYRNK